MRELREGEIVTQASLVSALRIAAEGAAPAGRPLTFTVRVGDAVAHAIVEGSTVDVGAGEHPGADLVISSGPGFRDLLAGALDPASAIAEQAVVVEGDPGLLADFASIFTVPYSGAAVGALRR